MYTKNMNFELLREAVPYYVLAFIVFAAVISYIKGHDVGYKKGTINAERAIRGKP